MDKAKLPPVVADALAAHNLDTLVELLTTGDLSTRQATVEALSTLDDPAAVTPLLTAWETIPADRGHRALRQAIITSLAHYQDLRAGPVLLSCAQTGPDRQIKKAAQKALENLGWTRKSDPHYVNLVAQLHAEKPNLRCDAAKALGQAGNADAIRWLVLALQDLHVMVRKHVADALDALGWQPPDINSPNGYAYWIAKSQWDLCSNLDGQNLSLFKKALQHPDTAVRMGVCSRLRLLPAEQAVPLLGTMLNDESQYVQRTAYQALTQHATSEAIVLLNQSFPDADATTRKEILQSLRWDTAKSGTLSLLELALKDPEAEVRRVACTCIGHIPPEQRGTLLIQALQDEDGAVHRGAGVYLVNRITGIENRLEILQLAFNSDAAGLRQQACLGAGQLSDTTSLGWIAKALQDTQTEVCQAAVQSLIRRGDRGDPHVPELLGFLLRHPDEQLRHLAIDVIAGSKSPWGIPPLITALPTLGKGFNLSGVIDLLKASEHPQRSTWLVRLLRHPELPTRRKAVEALQDMETADAVTPLMAVLQDSDAGVRRAAAQALGKFKTHPHAAQISEALHPLLSDPIFQVRAAAIEALGSLGAPQVCPLFIRMLQEDSSDIVRSQAARTLADVGDPQALPALHAALEDRMITVRFAATLALLRLGDEQGWIALQEFIDFSNSMFHQEIIHILSTVSDIRAVGPLMILQQDARILEILRTKASEALDRLSDRVPQVQQMRDNLAMLEKDITTRKDTDIDGHSTQAAMDLVRFGDAAVTPLILTLSQSTYAHFALGLFGGEAAFQALCQELHSRDWMRMAAAADALAQRGDPRAIPELEPLQNDAHIEVQRAVTTALAKLGAPATKWPTVDREAPYKQIQEVWAQFDTIRRDPQQRARALTWHAAIMEIMDTLPFNSDAEYSNAWGMLGTLGYYFLNPDRQALDTPCPTAATCYRRCLAMAPERKDIAEKLAQVEPESAAPQVSSELPDMGSQESLTERQEPALASGEAVYYVRKLSSPEDLFASGGLDTSQNTSPQSGAIPAQHMQWIEQLLELVNQSMAANSLDVGRDEARQIGEAINAAGGFPLMKKIAESAGEQGKSRGQRYALGYIERWWNGIGAWQA